MDEKELRTSPKQRLFIILIAVFMVGSIVASYAAIVISGSQSSNATDSKVDEAKIAEYSEVYSEIQAKFTEATKDDFNKFIGYKSGTVTAYNENTANENGVKVEDLQEGSGVEVTDSNYLAYYVGWCADESVFDSSFDNNDNPTGFAKILDPSLGMIEGWTLGVEGMRLDGIRVITVPGELAYGDKMEICGGYNKPLKFMIYAKEKTDTLANMAAELDEAYMRLQYAYYGIDYDTVKANSE
ncbi:FKBP-type peptidyl-prolyl cis-trans isomerase [Candidatus Saccharibacteria bacterium]|nr:FKBP-type peptidyl-prolyl cis-trans isomerase [Candidatus Saccharibacteria bacterium]